MRTVAEINFGHLKHNFKTLLDLALEGKKPRLTNAYGSEKPGLVPMIKANAYGHGLVPMARELSEYSDVVALGIASIEEALELRFNGIKTPLWVFAQGAKLSREDWGVFQRYNLVPILHSVEDVTEALFRKEKIPFHVKVNTGMNRLGVEPAELKKIKTKLMDARQYFQGICTHYGTPENVKNPVSKKQTQVFLECLDFLKDHKFSYVHASSTVALEKTKELGLQGVCNVARPGIGLYGYGLASSYGLKPVMHFKAKVIKMRTLSKGDAVGYGAIFKAPRALKEAIIGIGYGDGFPRSLSNGMLQKRKILGRVSMDLTAVEGNGLKEGEWLTIFGINARNAEMLATQADTIVYELLTSVSGRVPRLYL